MPSCAINSDRTPYSQPTPFETVAATIREDVPAAADAILGVLDPEAAASASIGQVHRARRPDGTEVAVKVRHPIAARASLAAGQAFKTKRAIFRLRLPGKLLFLFRIRFGLCAVLARLGAQADWRAIESELTDEALAVR